ncbi:MAG: N-acetyltransferase [Candidatus Lambdaproteobacteria bacterium]|nr:N-acetyltransferase [Candidatus Lambdaproteobacteria bacterium]
MGELTIEALGDLAALPRAEWNRLVGAGSPFLEWDWLASLEESACVTRERGWQPLHLVVRREGALVGACPLYVKGNSEGEFVFDHQFAHAALRAGLAYYPKLLVGVPFTPASGERFLTAPGEDRPSLIRLMGRALLELCRQHGLSSVHVNFCSPEEAEALGALGFQPRLGMQYHWENPGYGSFEDYLQRFRSKRRNKIRRELREMEQRGIAIRAVSGTAIGDELFPAMYRLYAQHVRSLHWGREYLNERFFGLLARRYKHNLCFMVAYREGQLQAGTFNVQKGGVFYGRYWGAHADIPYLHFNVCYYAAIAHCIGDGLRRFEPGAGGNFKQLRGFDPRPTLSMHHFSDPGLHEGVAGYLEGERRQTTATIDRLREESQLKAPEE